MNLETVKTSIKQIIDECNSPLCASYEYDATPTAEERLKNVLKLAEQALKEFNNTTKYNKLNEII